MKHAFTNIAKASYRLSYTPETWWNSTAIFLPKPGKDYYYNPKAYLTITLAPVPLKWMERLILWHMEADLKIYSKLSKKQYDFMRGCSTAYCGSYAQTRQETGDSQPQQRNGVTVKK